jgi:hypothetical protein
VILEPRDTHEKGLKKHIYSWKSSADRNIWFKVIAGFLKPKRPTLPTARAGRDNAGRDNAGRFSVVIGAVLTGRGGGGGAAAGSIEWVEPTPAPGSSDERLWNWIKTKCETDQLPTYAVLKAEAGPIFGDDSWKRLKADAKEHLRRCQGLESSAGLSTHFPGHSDDDDGGDVNPRLAQLRDMDAEFQTIQRDQKAKEAEFRAEYREHLAEYPNAPKAEVAMETAWMMKKAYADGVVYLGSELETSVGQMFDFVTKHLMADNASSQRQFVRHFDREPAEKIAAMFERTEGSEAQKREFAMHRKELFEKSVNLCEAALKRL